MMDSWYLKKIAGIVEKYYPRKKSSIYDNELNKFGLSTRNPDGSYKSTYEILKEISDLWERLN